MMMNQQTETPFQINIRKEKIMTKKELEKLIREVARDEFKVTLASHTQLETSYKDKSLEYFDSIRGEMVK